MSISLPLSKEVAKLAKEIGDNKKKPGTKLTIDRCLRHFTMSELLVDHVLCPSCGIKTPTRKQHVVSRLPKVLCLHLKRFDGVLKKKVDDFVSFPGRGLNMGPYLPHWYALKNSFMCFFHCCLALKLNFPHHFLVGPKHRLLLLKTS
jgi:Ubiquitin carboxyl-terminal hydrolase